MQHNQPLKSAIGFGLVELMLSLGIFSMLVAIGGVQYQRFVTHARYNRAKSEMAAISAMVQGYCVTLDQTLFQIMTPSVCIWKDMGCSPGALVSSCSSPAVGIPYWQRIGYDSIPVDPWGNDYLMDQNEGELNGYFGGGTGYPGEDCRNDAVWSAGADGIYEGTGVNVSAFPDDLLMRIPFYSNPTCPAPWDNVEFEGGE